MRLTTNAERLGGRSSGPEVERPAFERAQGPSEVEAAALTLVRDLVAERDPKALALLLGGPASAGELQAIAQSQGSSRELAERVLAAVESALRAEVERSDTPRVGARPPTAKARRQLEQLAEGTVDGLHRQVRVRSKATPAFEPAPGGMDRATHRQLYRAVDRQLRSTLQLSPEARARVIDDATTAIQSTIAASLAERGLAAAPVEVKQRGFLSGLKAVVERASNAVSKLAHGLREAVRRPGAAKVEGQKEPIGARIADAVAAFGGSWKFIISALTVIGAWVTANTVLGFHFDPYPFILLNLFLSVVAALQGPVILMSANRQAVRDRAEADETHGASIRAEEDLKALRAEHAELKGMVQQLLEAQQAAKPKDDAPSR